MPYLAFGRFRSIFDLCQQRRLYPNAAVREIKMPMRRNRSLRLSLECRTILLVGTTHDDR
jgi:hypothetical protein